MILTGGDEATGFSEGRSVVQAHCLVFQLQSHLEQGKTDMEWCLVWASAESPSDMVQAALDSREKLEVQRRNSIFHFLVKKAMGKKVY
jgi:hypothetical protein